MNSNLLVQPIENKSSFKLNLELKELCSNGTVKFFSEGKENRNTFWNDDKFVTPIYGVYKVSWGFYQNSIHTFYKDAKVVLELIINNKLHEENPEITKETPSFHALKSCYKTLTLLLRENETLALNVKSMGVETPNMKDVYFKIEKLELDDDSNFGYEN